MRISRVIKRLERIQDRVESVRIKMAYSHDHGYDDEILTGFLAGVEEDIRQAINTLKTEQSEAYSEEQIQRHLNQAGRTTAEFATAEALVAIGQLIFNSVYHSKEDGDEDK